jgi:hypothetical protein
MGNYRTATTSNIAHEKANQTPQQDKNRNPGWHILLTQKWVQLGRLTLGIYLLTQPYIGFTCSGGRSVPKFG